MKLRATFLSSFLTGLILLNFITTSVFAQTVMNPPQPDPNAKPPKNSSTDVKGPPATTAKIKNDDCPFKEADPDLSALITNVNDELRKYDAACKVTTETVKDNIPKSDKNGGGMGAPKSPSAGGDTEVTCTNFRSVLSQEYSLAIDAYNTAPASPMFPQNYSSCGGGGDRKITTNEPPPIGNEPPISNKNLTDITTKPNTDISTDTSTNTEDKKKVALDCLKNTFDQLVKNTQATCKNSFGTSKDTAVSDLAKSLVKTLGDMNNSNCSSKDAKDKVVSAVGTSLLGIVGSYGLNILGGGVGSVLSSMSDAISSLVKNKKSDYQKQMEANDRNLNFPSRACQVYYVQKMNPTTGRCKEDVNLQDKQKVVDDHKAVCDAGDPNKSTVGKLSPLAASLIQ